MAPRTRGRKKGIPRASATLAQPETGTQLVPRNRPASHNPGVISEIAASLEGGKEEFMLLARYAPEIDPNIAPVIEEWNRLKKQPRLRVSLDAICKLKGIDPFHFLGVVAEAAIKYRDNASVILAAMALPKVVQQSIQVAMEKDGFRDREALMKHAGFLPVPAGATFVNSPSFKNEQVTQVDTASSALPSFEKSVKDLDVVDI